MYSRNDNKLENNNGLWIWQDNNLTNDGQPLIVSDKILNKRGTSKLILRIAQLCSIDNVSREGETQDKTRQDILYVGDSRGWTTCCLYLEMLESGQWRVIDRSHFLRKDESLHILLFPEWTSKLRFLEQLEIRKKNQQIGIPLCIISRRLAKLWFLLPISFEDSLKSSTSRNLHS